jgi:phenylalanyl-tRNA synthetase beta chain
MPANMLESKSNMKSIDSIKDALVSLGYNEAISYSFISKDTEINLHGNNNLIELENPIASNLSVMRSKMWGSHIEALLYNLNRGQKIVRLFEIASVYKSDNGTFTEEKFISGLAYGDQIPEQCGEKNREINFYDIKGDIENISCNTLSFIKASDHTPACLHPGKTAEIMLEKTKVGWVGNLHPSWQQKFELPRDTYLFELNTNVFNDLKDLSYFIPGKFIPVRRDISVLIDKEIVVGDVVKYIYSRKIKNLVKFEPFDIYQGDGIENNKKSIAFLILIQDTYKTLEDNDVSKIVDQVINSLENKFCAKLR